jgi:hypothetical protein
LSPDAERERREGEDPPPRRPRPPAAQQAPLSPEDEDGPSLIDVRV